MDKCAKQYCDFWNETEQTCALALEVHEKVELFRRLNNISAQLEKTGRERMSAKLIKHLTDISMQLH